MIGTVHLHLGISASAGNYAFPADFFFYYYKVKRTSPPRVYFKYDFCFVTTPVDNYFLNVKMCKKNCNYASFM